MPTKTHGKVSVLKLDTAGAVLSDISAYLNTIKFSRDPDRPRVPTFGDLAGRFPIIGLRASQIDIAGYWEPSAASKIHGKAVRILQDQYSLSSFTFQGKLGRKIDVPNVPTFGDLDKKYDIFGLGDGTFNFTGYFDGTAAGFDTIMRTAMLLDPAVTALPFLTVGMNGLAIGAQVDMFQAVPTKYDVDTGEEKPVEVMADYAVDDQIDLGVSLHDLVAETTGGATVNYTSVDETAVSTANGWAAHLHATAYSGFTSATMKVQDSADNSAFADVAGATFTALTAAGKQRLVGASNATVRRYVRGVCTTVGAGSVTFSIGFARRGFTYGTAGTHRHFCGVYGVAINPTTPGATPAALNFEFGPLGTVTPNPKHTGLCRLASYDVDFGEQKPVTFSVQLLISGPVTDTTY